MSSVIKELELQYKLAVNNHGLIKLSEVTENLHGMKLATVINGEQAIVVAGAYGRVIIIISNARCIHDGRGDWGEITAHGMIIGNVVSGLPCITMAKLFDDSIDQRLDRNVKLSMMDSLTAEITDALETMRANEL